ncbi:DUF3168 domain-containing protein [Alteraurantiacibacter aquimixticola]|uniref:DUF3168 domain-containing protein n=1 Tax=Alteraurantiacibacter aquimixticola TaxID=2489173 RepID=A0A4T3EZM7_9SPHN|nr:DUF3168 domain-containing protein [Alteraurantiacibacter aquimixticola]TIX49382.1 DUF3168 domain-containing protein [Alteraurantiacibacter aquimixticola]
MFETRLRSALVEWLRDDPALAGQLNAVTEEAPVRTSAPWLGIVASASSDWSAKDRKGREVRVAIELHVRGDAPDTAADLTSAIEARVETLPPAQSGFTVITTQFLRARAEQRPANLRAILIEYRFRLLEA